jgi:hypothetical protein
MGPGMAKVFGLRTTQIGLGLREIVYHDVVLGRTAGEGGSVHVQWRCANI